MTLALAGKTQRSVCRQSQVQPIAPRQQMSGIASLPVAASIYHYVSAVALALALSRIPSLTHLNFQQVHLPKKFTVIDRVVGRFNCQQLQLFSIPLALFVFFNSPSNRFRNPLAFPDNHAALVLQPFMDSLPFMAVAFVPSLQRRNYAANAFVDKRRRTCRFQQRL